MWSVLPVSINGTEQRAHLNIAHSKLLSQVQHKQQRRAEIVEALQYHQGVSKVQVPTKHRVKVSAACRRGHLTATGCQKSTGIRRTAQGCHGFYKIIKFTIESTVCIVKRSTAVNSEVDEVTSVSPSGS